MKSARFSVTSRTEGDAAVIYPNGYLNNIAGESLVEECNRYIEKGTKKFVINLRDTGFINSIGISLLLNILEKLKNMEGTLCFTGMSSIHRDTFEMLGLTPHMLMFQSESEALQHLKAGGL